MKNLIVKTTELAMNLASEYISPGDIVIDATCGNGHDTLTLARLVGLSGKVYAFDIQSLAIENTKSLLAEDRFSDVGVFIQDSHHRLKEHIPVNEQGSIAAILFNLGYLPKGDKGITTTTASTLIAVKESFDLIRPDGLVAITVYSGHSEGAKEKEALLELVKDLPEQQYHVAYINFINQKKNAPELLLITKKARPGT